MTVSELIVDLQKLEAQGLGDWPISRMNYDDGHEYAAEDFILSVRKEAKEVEIS